MDIRLIFLNRLFIVTRSGGTQEDMHASDWKCLSERVARQDRKIRSVVKVRRCTGGSTDPKMLIPHCQENLRNREYQVSVPETATGRLVENTKVRETTLAKELGKITS